MLVAQIFSDPGQRVVNWAAGNVVLPTPDQDQQITWNANTQQLGRGANKIQLDDGTGNVSIPGSLTVTGSATMGGLTTTNDIVINTNPGNNCGRVIGGNPTHAIVLRGDAEGGEPYTINPSICSTWVEWNGIWRFRQIQGSSNSIGFEINPTHVNIPTSLLLGGYTAGMRSFVPLAVPGGTGGVYWSRGQNAASCVTESLGVHLCPGPSHTRTSLSTSLNTAC